MTSLTVFSGGRVDNHHRHVVAARSRREAAALFGSLTADYVQPTTDKSAIAAAMRDPGVVMVERPLYSSLWYSRESLVGKDGK